MEAKAQHHLYPDVFNLDFSKAFDTVPYNLLLEKWMGYGLDKRSVRRVNWLAGCKHRLMEIEPFQISNLSQVESPQGSILGPMLLNTVICDVDDGIECTLMKFADDTKLIGEVDTLEGKAILQEDLDRLEQWANENMMKFNKGKYKVLCLEKHNPRLQHSLGSTCLESSSMERDLGILMDHMLSMSDQCVTAATKKAKRVLCCIKRSSPSETKNSLPHST